MSLAEDLLMSLPDSEDVGARIGGVAEEGHIVVDERRIITVPSELRSIAVTGDKDIETVTFDCVRYWDGHDLSTFNIFLNYILPKDTDGEPRVGSYAVPPLGISVTENQYSFNWTIGKTIARIPGKITISITAIETDGEGNELRRWSSFMNTEMTIVEGLAVSAGDGEEELDGSILPEILDRLKGTVYEGDSEPTDYEYALWVDTSTTPAMVKYKNDLGAWTPIESGTSKEAGLVGVVMGDDDVDRHVWFSRSNEEKARAFDDDFKYNPATGKLKAPIFSGIAEKVATMVSSDSDYHYVPFSRGSQNTNELSIASNFFFQPSTGTLYATKFQGTFAGTATSAGVATRAYNDSQNNPIHKTYATFNKEWEGLSIKTAYAEGTYQVQMLFDDVWEFVIVQVVGHKTRVPFRGNGWSHDWRLIVRPNRTIYAISNSGSEADYDVNGECMIPWEWARIRRIG